MELKYNFKKDGDEFVYEVDPTDEVMVKVLYNVVKNHLVKNKETDSLKMCLGLLPDIFTGMTIHQIRNAYKRANGTPLITDLRWMCRGLSPQFNVKEIVNQFFGFIKNNCDFTTPECVEQLEQFLEDDLTKHYAAEAYDYYSDGESLKRDPYSYYGVSRRDFV
jgi:hypothetical protein